MSQVKKSILLIHSPVFLPVPRNHLTYSLLRGGHFWKLHKRTSSCNCLTPTREEKRWDKRWGMYVNYKTLWRRLATVHSPKAQTTCILGKQSILGISQRSPPVWWTNCTPTNFAIRCTRLHPPKNSRHNVMSCDNLNASLMARAICIHWRNYQIMLHVCKLTTVAQRTLDMLDAICIFQ